MYFNPPKHKSTNCSLSNLDVAALLMEKCNVLVYFTNKWTKPNSKLQGSAGIRQWTINLCTSLKMIHKILLSEDYNWWLKRLDTQLKEPTNQSLLKSQKLKL